MYVHVVNPKFFGERRLDSRSRKNLTSISTFDLPTYILIDYIVLLVLRRDLNFALHTVSPSTDALYARTQRNI